jgi:hypothetical protein
LVPVSTKDKHEYDQKDEQTGHDSGDINQNVATAIESEHEEFLHPNLIASTQTANQNFQTEFT